jgi:BON domain
MKVQHMWRPARRKPLVRRVHFGRDEGLVLAGAACGAALEFMLDPRLGRRRRALARDRMVGAARGTARRTGRFGRRLAAYGRGRTERALRRRRAHDVVLDDATLADRVRTELFRPADVPKGQISVNVQAGIVQLRGEVTQSEIIRDLGRRAGEIGGVRAVENLLHTPGTPAPMHQ